MIYIQETWLSEVGLTALSLTQHIDATNVVLQKCNPTRLESHLNHTENKMKEREHTESDISNGDDFFEEFYRRALKSLSTSKKL